MKIIPSPFSLHLKLDLQTYVPDLNDKTYFNLLKIDIILYNLID